MSVTYFVGRQSEKPVEFTQPIHPVLPLVYLLGCEDEATPFSFTHKDKHMHRHPQTHKCELATSQTI